MSDHDASVLKNHGTLSDA